MTSHSDAAVPLAAVSSALAPIFRGKFCDTLLPGRDMRSFEPHEVIYELGEKDRTLFFIRHGVVKTGSITDTGREIIYDLRKGGDLIGELCALQPVRQDRAVALEATQVVPLDLDDVIQFLTAHPALLSEFLSVFSRALLEAYEQVNRLAGDDVMHGLGKVLRNLAIKLGRPAGELVEIDAYLTQEELSQMVIARRERVCTALNQLRRRGIAQYSPRGHLLLDLRALDKL